MKIKTLTFFLLSLTSFLLITATAQAAQPGIYAGGQIGYANSNYSPANLNAIYVPTLYQSQTSYLTGPASVKVNGANVGARVFIGYQWNKYFGFEGGYTDYGTSQVDNLFGDENLGEQLSENAFDLVAKASLPITQRFNLYVKGGMAYVMTQNFSSSATTDGSALSFLNSFQYTLNDVSQLRPIYGAGMSFNFTKHLSSDVFWSQIISGSRVPTTNFAGVGLAYHF